MTLMYDDVEHDVEMDGWCTWTSPIFRQPPFRLLAPRRVCGDPGRVALGAAVSPEKTFFSA